MNEGKESGEALARGGPASIRRLLVAVPDALTSAAFVLVWHDPLFFGEDSVQRLMLVMMLEFMVVHSSGFMGVVVFEPTASRQRRTLAVLGLSVFYLLFVAGWSVIYSVVWPLLAFAWLLFSRLSDIWLDPKPVEADRIRQLSWWAASVVFFVGGVFVTIAVPLPRLGLTPEVVPTLGLDGGGLWIEQPHTVIAFGAGYFLAQSLLKVVVAALAGSRRIPASRAGG
jgi:hypothetical protein